MLELYYDFIDVYIPRLLFEDCGIVTDSTYLALAGRLINDLVDPVEREQYFRHRRRWLPGKCCNGHDENYVQCRLAGRTWDTANKKCCTARRAYDKRTSGLFKEEFSGRGLIALCSKTY